MVGGVLIKLRSLCGTRGGGWLDGKIAMHTTYRCMPTDDIIVLIINLLLPLH